MGKKCDGFDRVGEGDHHGSRNMADAGFFRVRGLLGRQCARA
jgi:hypothetical protein